MPIWAIVAIVIYCIIAVLLLCYGIATGANAAERKNAERHGWEKRMGVVYRVTWHTVILQAVFWPFAIIIGLMRKADKK